jgi:transcriptional regulator with XRE-family HTH domain
MDIPNFSWISMSDSALLKAIGTFIKHQRLEQNKTQSQLAQDAGINRSTLIEFEQGKRSNLMTFVQVLRALKQLHILKAFQVNQEISPIQLAKMEQAKRKRAGRKKQIAKKTKSPW